MSKKKLLIIGIVLLVIVVIVALVIFNLNNSKDTAVLKVETVKHEVVDNLYNDLDKNEDEKYVSKLYGYTSDKDKNITMIVKEGYLANNKVYDLDGNELGDYSEDTLNALLDKGTTKVYNYKNDNDKYTLENK